jgi:hypothetical protein
VKRMDSRESSCLGSLNLSRKGQAWVTEGNMLSPIPSRSAAVALGADVAASEAGETTLASEGAQAMCRKSAGKKRLKGPYHKVGGTK